MLKYLIAVLTGVFTMKPGICSDRDLVSAEANFDKALSEVQERLKETTTVERKDVKTVRLGTQDYSPRERPSSK